MKIRFETLYPQMKNTTSIWYLLKPHYKKLWMGQMTYIGLNAWYLVIDRRGIDNLQDFADAMKYPNVWKILKRFK